MYETDHDYRVEELQQQEAERKRKIVFALVADNHGDIVAEAYTNYIIDFYDLTGMSFAAISALADDLFICEQCHEVEDKEYLSNVEEHQDICTTCAGNR